MPSSPHFFTKPLHPSSLPRPHQPRSRRLKALISHRKPKLPPLPPFATAARLFTEGNFFTVQPSFFIFFCNYNLYNFVNVNFVGIILLLLLLNLMLLNLVECPIYAAGRVERRIPLNFGLPLAIAFQIFKFWEELLPSSVNGRLWKISGNIQLDCLRYSLHAVLMKAYIGELKMDTFVWGLLVCVGGECTVRGEYIVMGFYHF